MQPITVYGNILMSRTQVIAHQTNCKGVMEDGLAKQIADKYPQILRSYRIYCERSNPLGTCLLTPVSPNGPYIANIFGQDNFSETKQSTDYKALKNALNDLIVKMKTNRLSSVSIPYGIGCGLAGGDWNIVSRIINELFTDTNIHTEIWKLQNENN